MSAVHGQLQQYARDFQTLVSRHRELEIRYEHLRASHRQLAGASDVLRSMGSRTGLLCLVTNLQGDIEQATDRASELFERTGKPGSSLARVVSLFHLPRLYAMLRPTPAAQISALSEPLEILLNPYSQATKEQIFVGRTLLASTCDPSRLYWIVRELSQREQTEIVTGSVSTSGDGPTATLVFNLAGGAEAADAGFLALAGLNISKLSELNVSALCSPVQNDLLRARGLPDELLRTGQWQTEVTTVGKKRLAQRQWMQVSSIQNCAGSTVAYVASLTDQERMLMAQRRVLDAHDHDPVTGLPNQTLFKERAATRIAATGQTLAPFTLVSVSLDQHQWIQEAYGSLVGDMVAERMATRLREVIRGCDTLGQVAPAQFLVILEGVTGSDAIAQIVMQMTKALSAPVTVRHQTMQVSASIGCATFPQDGFDLPTLISNAETAMRRSSKAGGNRFEEFNPSGAKATGPKAHNRRGAPTRAETFTEPTITTEFDL